MCPGSGVCPGSAMCVQVVQGVCPVCGAFPGGVCVQVV